MIEPSRTFASPTRRVIFLGASNLIRSFSTVVATARQTWCEPIEMMVAMGHGRSYGQETSVLGRKISGIFPCALWQDLQTRAKLPTTALVTDVGNDLVYGIAPAQLLEWVERCLDRLDAAGAQIMITQAPVESIERLSEWRFQLFRRLFFPQSAITLEETKRLVREINERLVRLGESRKIPIIPVSGLWYGLDPIHYARRAKREAWSTLLRDWRTDSKVLTGTRSTWMTSAYLAGLTPAEWSQFGIARRSAQPCGRFFDGSTLSLY